MNLNLRIFFIFIATCIIWISFFNVRIEIYFFLAHSVLKDRVYMWIFEEPFVHSEIYTLTLCIQKTMNNKK